MKIVISRLFSMLLFATVVITSCSKETELQVVKGYKVNIRATNNSGTKAINEVDLGDGKFKAVTTFSNTEEIYFCNLSDGNKIDATAINPTPDGGDAHNARIVGDLSGATSSSVTISYAVDNNLRLLYNTPATGIVDYASQDGAFANLIIAATADVTITGTGASGKEITASNATFSNLQSIFKFSFKIGSTDTYLGKSVRFVRIFSTQGKLLSQYNAVTGSSTYGPVTISRDIDLPSNYVYTALRFDPNPGDEIVFQVVTNDGKVYSGSKTAPTAGFENGKFYTSTVNVNLYTFTISSPGSTPIKKAYISPGDLGIDNSVYSFTEPFTNWGYGTNKQSDAGWNKRVWFDFGYTASCPVTVYEIEGWRVGSKFSGSTAYEWNYIFGRTNMNENVAPWYKVTIEGHGCCLLLPPDETELTNPEKTELESGSIGSYGYVKYLGKGFVLLMSAGRATFKSNKTGNAMQWEKSGEGWYWASNYQSNRTYFSWTNSSDPACNNAYTTNLRMHARLFKDVQ